jgi:hypothetical protein
VDVFKLRDQLVEDCWHYAESILAVTDEWIGKHVEPDLEQWLLLPDPALQLKPGLRAGQPIDELVRDGLLHTMAVG